jgi:hypothetical protein
MGVAYTCLLLPFCQSMQCHDNVVKVNNIPVSVLLHIRDQTLTCFVAQPANLLTVSVPTHLCSCHRPQPVVPEPPASPTPSPAAPGGSSSTAVALASASAGAQAVARADASAVAQVRVVMWPQLQLGRYLPKVHWMYDRDKSSSFQLCLYSSNQVLINRIHVL